MISGSFEYDSEVSLWLFRHYLALRQPLIQSSLIVYESEDDTPSLKPIELADVLLVFTRRLNTAGEELDRFRAYCAAGKPIVGIRTASHAFQNWLAFDKDVLGGNYQGHYGHGPICRVSANAPQANHPILQGVSDFDTYGSLYKNTPLASDTNLLLTGHADGHTEPVAWTRDSGRVFYTSLGHQEDFGEQDFLRLLTNAVLWAGGRL